MSKYKKKPVIIEAVEWGGQNFGEVQDFTGRDNSFINKEGNLIIKTLEGDHLASKGDMIIRGVKGEFYPCKPDIFMMTYDLVKTLT